MTSVSFWICTLFLCFLALPVALHAQLCPPDYFVQPCTCKTESNAPAFTCKRMVDMAALKRVLYPNFKTPISKFTLSDSFLLFFPATAVRERKITSFRVESSALYYLFDDVPGENDVLSELRIVNSKIIGGIDWKLFKNFKNLTNFEIDGAHIKRLGKEFAENVNPALYSLRLANNNVSELEDGVFGRFTTARHLQVAGGKIKVLRRSMFPEENVFRTLGFNDNWISSLPDDIFSNMPQLQVVYLDRNRLTTFPETVFGELYARSVKMTFVGNNLKCDCSVKWVPSKNRNVNIDAKCHSPDNMKGKSFKELKLSDFYFCNCFIFCRTGLNFQN